MTASAEHRDLLRATFGGQGFTVVRLSGGLHGRCYRVMGADIDCAARLPAPDAGQFRLDTRVEREVLSRVAAAGLAPAVIPTPSELGIVATRFLARARPWSADDARQLANIDRLAARLRTLHALELELEPFAASAAGDAYVRAASIQMEFGSEQRCWRDELLRLASAFEAQFPAAVPCHNDLVAGNVLDDGELWLIDFEYATLSAPILDLAGLAGLNDFDAGERLRLVRAYYGDERVPFDATALDGAIRLVRLLAYFWVLAYGLAAEAPQGAADFADAMAAMLR